MQFLLHFENSFLNRNDCIMLPLQNFHRVIIYWPACRNVEKTKIATLQHQRNKFISSVLIMNLCIGTFSLTSDRWTWVSWHDSVRNSMTSYESFPQFAFTVVRKTQNVRTPSFWFAFGKCFIWNELPNWLMLVLIRMSPRRFPHGTTSCWRMRRCHLWAFRRVHQPLLHYLISMMHRLAHAHMIWLCWIVWKDLRRLRSTVSLT